MNMRYKFKATITYCAEIEADSEEEAIQEVFELLADDVTRGEIRMDYFEDEEGGDGDSFPMLEGVEVLGIAKSERGADASWTGSSEASARGNVAPAGASYRPNAE